MTPQRGERIQDPLLMRAFAEGVQQGMESIYRSDEPEWEVTVSYDGTPLRQFKTQRPSEILKATEEAIGNGCSILIEVVSEEYQRPESIGAAITAPNDDEIVDAEVVD